VPWLLVPFLTPDAGRAQPDGTRVPFVLIKSLGIH
jgi:hypothetical protein